MRAFERLEPVELAVRTVSYDALLLDLHLPDGRGLDFLRKIRRRGDALPVVILTARDLVSDRIEGLKAGADDYIVKPFDLDEVNARLEAVTRRLQSVQRVSSTRLKGSAAWPRNCCNCPGLAQAPGCYENALIC